jgi:hypothetical protein
MEALEGTLGMNPYRYFGYRDVKGYILVLGRYKYFTLYFKHLDLIGGTRGYFTEGYFEIGVVASNRVF